MIVTPAVRPIASRSALRGPGRQMTAVALGTAILALSSYMSVPMAPVPITMQTLAVTMVGALFGSRLGTITVLAWLAEAAVGAPVLQGGAGGLAVFAGFTAGYLWSFPFVAALVGVLVERGWDGRRPILSFAAMALGNAVCLGMGGVWLATLIGASAAMTTGVTPFLLGGLVKSALGAAFLMALTARRR